MGIVNLTDDSFSGDGTLDPAEALAHARELLAQGADIIDVGAESARANRGPIPCDEEIARLRPFLEAFPGLSARHPGPPYDGEQLWPPLLSANTWRPEVVEAVLPLGVDLLNDIGALPDERNARLCAEHGVALVLMHSTGRPKESHLHQDYPDIWAALDAFFSEKIALAERAGLGRDRLLLDPGIDFAKQPADNLRVYRELDRLKKFDRPVLLPVSRKTVIGDVLGIEVPAARDAGTVACVVSGFLRGAAVFRVHNVRATAQTLKVLSALAPARQA